jgi:PAS domain S-box-containing protein
MKVLIADDSSTQLDLLNLLITSWGYEAVLASDGVQALEALAGPGDTAPQLAVLDWLMPGMTGLEVIHAIRETPRAVPPYLILLSALGTQQDVIEGLEAGANDYVKKPPNIGELRARIEVGVRVLDLQKRLAERVGELQAAVGQAKQAEEESQRLLTAIEQAAEGVVITDPKGAIHYVNAAFTRMTGYSRQQAVGRNPRLLNSGQHDPKVYQELWKTIMAGQVWKGEIVNRRADGTLYNEQMSITPIFDSAGAIANFIAIKMDVTAQRAAETELAREQELVRTLMNNVPDAIYFKDSGCRFVRVNRALAARLGLQDPSQAIGRSENDFLSEDQASAASGDDRQILATGVPLISKEERETWPDGSITWAASTKMPLRGLAGDIIGTFGISRDITNRKRIEDALRESEQRHRFQGSLLNAIYDASPDGILVVDPNGTILAHNRRFLEIWRLEPHDHTGLEDRLVLAPATLNVRNPENFQRRIAELYANPAAEDHCEIELQDGRILDRISLALGGADGEYLGRVWFFRDITERKRAEEAKTFLASVVQSSEDAIFGTQRGTIVSWNRGAEAMFGYSEEEVRGRHVSMLARPGDEAAVARVLDRLRHGEGVSNLEMLGLRKNGSQFDVSLTVSPIKNAEGIVVSEATSARDITARKLAEQVRAEETRLAILRAEVGSALTRRGPLRSGLQECAEALVRSTGVAFARIWILHPDGDALVLEASAGIYTHLDGKHARVPVGSFKIGRIAQTKLPHLSNSVQTDPEVSDHEWAAQNSLVSFVGHPLLVENDVVGVAAAFGYRPLGEPTLLAFAAIANQIAQFIHAKRAETALQRSEERARLLFTAVPHPAYVVDLETLSFLEVNDRAVERYGYSRDEFLRMKITEIRPSGEVARLQEYLRALPDGESAGQWQHQAKDGTVIDVEISFHVFEYAGRRAALTVAQDVTERKKLELELRHAQKLESVGRLASGIAHEINTPIQFVGDNMRFLRDSFAGLDRLLAKFQELAQAAAGVVPDRLLGEVSEAAAAADLEYILTEIPKALDQSLEGTSRVATIVKAMKDFAHPQQNNKMAANLNQALASTLVVARNELKYVADVETNFGDLPPVHCHLGDLNQVFLNLLINAAHAIAATVDGNGHRGKITVRTSHDGDWVRISIGDTGCGISEDIRTKVFDPFFTTKPVGKGTGQGLALCRSIIVEKHGGTLAFESEVGVGTTFFIGLPVSNPAD